MVRHPAVRAVHAQRHLRPVRLHPAQVVEKRQVHLGQVAHLRAPVVHFRVDVDGVLAVPRRVEIVVPNALQIRRQRAGTRASREQIAPEGKIQFLQAVICIALRIAGKALVGRQIVQRILPVQGERAPRHHCPVLRYMRRLHRRVPIRRRRLQPGQARRAQIRKAVGGRRRKVDIRRFADVQRIADNVHTLAHRAAHCHILYAPVARLPAQQDGMLIHLVDAVDIRAAPEQNAAGEALVVHRKHLMRHRQEALAADLLLLADIRHLMHAVRNIQRPPITADGALVARHVLPAQIAHSVQSFGRFAVQLLENQVAKHLVVALAVGRGGQRFLGKLLRFGDSVLLEQLAHHGQVLFRIGIHAVAEAAVPAGILVQADSLQHRAAENHCAHATVAQRQGDVPVLGGGIGPQLILLHHRVPLIRYF